MATFKGWLCGVVAALVMSGSALHAQERPADPALRLWYDTPATAFESALPLGNGRTGAMVFGDVRHERLLLNDATLWSGGPIDPASNPKALAALPEVRQALFAGDYARAATLTKQLQGAFSESYQPLGDLLIDTTLPTGITTSTFRRELELDTATARTTFEASGVTYTREYFVSHADKVMIVRLTASRTGALEAALSASSPHHASVVADRHGDLLLSGRAPVHAEPNYRQVEQPVVYDDRPDGKGIRFAARVRVLQTDGRVTRAAQTLTISHATTAVIVVAVDTSFAGFDHEPGLGPDPAAATASRLAAITGRPYPTLRAAHVRNHQALFHRVGLDLGHTDHDNWPTDRRLRAYAAGDADPALEALYYQFGRYLLISASRPGSPAANLQGIWNPHVRAPWSSNYTVNINTEMNYWPAESTNLAECHEPLLRFIGDLARTGAVTARHFYGCGGWCVHHNTDIWALSNPVGHFGEGDPSWANWSMGGAWLSLDLWEHYAFTGDQAWLRASGYPLMKGAAAFVLDWLVEGPDGRLVTAPSTSPENYFVTPDGLSGPVDIMSTSDLALIRAVFRNVSAAAAVLGVDEPLRARIAAALARLPGYQIGKDGRLQEWSHDWADKDPEHRHVSHLIGLYPDNQITPLDTPDLAAAARRSLELRGDGGTGWSKAWKIGLWARLGDGDHAYRMLRTHLQYVGPTGDTEYRGGGTYPNLFDAHPPFQIDGNFGGTAGMTELLLQSHRGEVHLLPALPSAWKTGHVTGLRARGGSTIDIAWTDGALREAWIVADRTGSVRVRCGQDVRDVPVTAGVRTRIGFEH
jgi:alpha-L-fucosidase 2